MASATTDRRMGLTGDKGMKAPVDLATTANITLSGEQVIDGVLTSVSRVLVKNQTNTTQNGIYDTSSAAWTLAIDSNGNQDLVKGTLVLVTGGSQSGTFWNITTANPITPGTTALVWALSLTASSTLMSFLQAGTGAVARNAQTKMRADFNASDFATGGTGVAGNPYTGWETAFAAAPAGETLNLEAAVYTSAGGWTVNKALSIRGKGAGSILQFTGIAGSSVNIGIGGMTFNGTPRPAYPGTVYNMGTGTVTAGQTAFTFVSVTGLNVDDEVYLALGTDPNDGGQSFLRMFNRVSTIVGLTVTFAIPIPEAVTSVAWGAFGFSPTFNECVKFTNGIVQNFAIRDLTLTQTVGPGYDRCLFIMRSRNVVVDNIYIDDVLSGPIFGECENVKIGAIYGRRIRGSFFDAYGTRNLQCDVLSVNDLKDQGVVLENQNRGIAFRTVKLFGGPSKSTSTYFLAEGGSLGVSMENLQLAGPAVSAANAMQVIASSQVRVGDVQIGAGINTFPLKYCHGQLTFGGNRYSDRKRFRIQVPLYKNMTLVTYSLPNGLLRSLKGSLSATTGVTRVRLKNTSTSRDLVDSGNTINYFPAAAAFGEMTIDDFITIGTDASSFAVNSDPTGHQLQLSTDGTVTEGTLVTLEGEMYIPTDDGVKGQQQLNSQATLTSLATLNFGVPGAVPGSVDLTVSVPGAVFGDRVTVAAPVTIGANYLLTGFVSAADTVTVRWTQIAGAAADPDAGGGIYRVDVWKS